MSDRQPMISRETVRRVNELMVQRKSVDTSGLPRALVYEVRNTRLSAQQLRAAYAKALQREKELA